MILGARLLYFVLSPGGIIIALLLCTSWLALRPRQRAARLCAAVAVVSYLILSCYPLAAIVERWLERPFHALTKADVPPGRTVIVLLASGAYTATGWDHVSYSILDPIGAERTLEAARVFTLLQADWIISSGGEPDPDDPDVSGGVAMRDTLIRLGIPSDKILLEQQSQTTRDEAVVVSRMLKTLAVDNVVLVTSGIHMRRSLAVFRSAGVNAVPAVSRGSAHFTDDLTLYLPSQFGLVSWQYALHECLGLVYYRLRGWQA